MKSVIMGAQGVGGCSKSLGLFAMISGHQDKSNLD